MLVTIITDASFCSETNAAGYGYWIVCERGRKSGGGPVKSRVPCSMIAEMMACCNGLWIALSNGLVTRGDTVLIQTDCQPAIDLFLKTGKSYDKNKLEVLDYMAKIVQENELEVKYRHVKGHTDGSTPRTYVNNVCDKAAKKYMRLMRTHFRVETLKESLA